RERKGRQLYCFARLGYVLGEGQNQAPKRLVIAFRQAPAIGFIEVVDLKPGAQQIGVFVQLLFDEVVFVVLVFNVTQYFFNNILHADNTRSSSEFIQNNSKALVLIDEFDHQFISKCRFRDDDDARENFTDIARFSKESRRVTVSDYVIDSILVNNDFRMPALDEGFFQFLNSLLKLDSNNLRARYHAFPYEDGFEFLSVVNNAVFNF